MATSTSGRAPLTVQGAMGLLGLFAGLCAVFALITTIADAWREHAERRWPPATAHIESCTVDPYQPFGSGRHRPVWHIDCRISYTANDHQVETWVRSRSTASGWGGHLDQMREWVEEHAPGSSMVVHYDPADISKVVLADRHAGRGATDAEPGTAIHFGGYLCGAADDRQEAENIPSEIAP